MAQSTDENAIWLTQDAYDRLQAELDHLTGPVRAELAARIGAAREEGDLRENGGYHAAKDEQGKVEARIRQLTEMLRYAQVGETPRADGVVEPGMRVRVRFAGEEETEEFVLGSREIALDESIDVYSPQSPLGAAINGKKCGEQATYQAPNDRSVTVEIVAAVPY